MSFILPPMLRKLYGALISVLLLLISAAAQRAPQAARDWLNTLAVQLCEREPG